MKYINSSYLVFNKYDENITSKEGWIVNNLTDSIIRYAYIDFPTTSKEVYSRFDILHNSFHKNVSCYAFELCFEKTRISFYVDGTYSKYVLYKYLKSTGKYTATDFSYVASEKSTTRVSLSANTETGNVSIRILDKLHSFDFPELIGDKLSQVSLGLRSYNQTTTTRIKNIIISDLPINMNEEVTEIPIELLNSKWTNVDGTYSTDTTGNKIVFTPNLEGFERCNIKSAELIFEGSQSSENISSIKTSIGGETETKALSDTGLGIYGICVSNPDLTKEISVES